MSEAIIEESITEKNVEEVVTSEKNIEELMTPENIQAAKTLSISIFKCLSKKKESTPREVTPKRRFCCFK
jgi:hypothetical protein